MKGMPFYSNTNFTRNYKLKYQLCARWIEAVRYFWLLCDTDVDATCFIMLELIELEKQKRNICISFQFTVEWFPICEETCKNRSTLFLILLFSEVALTSTNFPPTIEDNRSFQNQPQIMKLAKDIQKEKFVFSLAAIDWVKHVEL